ncbi:hypothetical protein CDAR_89111 [Caerostris darwini]|uniref:Uncharacterized protein n=1 Tax=Caerostris darwini TaxID=1538125 RepID=A0AAV4WH91_9ARAC|nr:hypothetical protein CDAR_89111 [Caerostris darwini]
MVLFKITTRKRSQRTTDDFWRKYRPFAQPLKTHNTPLHKIAIIREKYGIAEINKQPFSKLQYIEEKAEIPLHTMAPGIDLKRVNILTTQFKSETLAMMVERYPSEECIHVYMDCSQKSEACSSGFFFSVAQGLIAVGKFATNFDSVLAARVMPPRY